MFADALREEKAAPARAYDPFIFGQGKANGNDNLVSPKSCITTCFTKRSMNVSRRSTQLGTIVENTYHVLTTIRNYELLW